MKALITWMGSTLVLVLLVAACGSTNGSASPAPAADSSKANAAKRIESLPNIDTSELTDAERELFLDMVNDQLSPCGEAMSVAKCVSTQAKCRSCVPAARYLVRLVMEGYDRSTIAEHYAGRFDKSKHTAIDMSDAPSRGAPMAKVTLVEFSDFQCPHCGAAHPETKRLLREFEGNVRLVYGYFPLSGHSRSMPAARAAEAARKQGKFWEMYDLLFENQRALEDADLHRYAEQLGLDMTRFRADLADPELQTRVEASKELGVKLGVEATPSFFVNGRKFRESTRSLPAYVREELELY
jgi:2-hydroxychromene-2-carboxylate isomerase